MTEPEWQPGEFELYLADTSYVPHTITKETDPDE